MNDTTACEATKLATIERVLRQRRTIKLLADTAFPETDHTAKIDRLIAAAGWAPFHKVCNPEHRDPEHQGQLDGIEPWRFHALDAGSCRALRQRVIGLDGAGKIPAMLASADALILATWLPNPAAPTSPKNELDFEPSLANVEHIAAAAAAVQSLLLAATAAGFETYWSSGGVLRSTDIFKLLKIPNTQHLLGAIFLFPAQIPDGHSAEIAESKLRGQRSTPGQWSRWVNLTV